jgi:hypothetical protein
MDIEQIPSDYRGVWYCCGTANVLPGKTYVYSGPMATYSAWHRPMAVYAPEANKTYFVFGNEQNAPAIGSYDHSTRQFSKPVVLGANPDGDAHRNPTLMLEDTGYLYVFFGAHNHPTKVLRSDRPYAIDSWQKCATIIDPKTSYPQPFQLQPDEIFVSYREATCGWRSRLSTNHAATWEEPIDIVAFEECAIYAVSIAATGDYPRKIHLTWSRLGGGTEEEIRTKHLWARRYNIYYACSEDGGLTWQRSNGALYDLPIVEETAEKLYDCGERGVWLKDIQLGLNGQPYVLFIDGDPFTFKSQWKCARLTDSRWRCSDIAVGDHMYDDGGIVIEDGAVTVYAPTTASQPQEDGGEIDVWRSIDGDTPWQRGEPLTAGSDLSHNNVKVVLNHQAGPGDMQVFWSYGDSLEPPATKESRLFAYGKGMTKPRVIRSR